MEVRVLTQEKKIETNVTGYKVLEYLSQGRKVTGNKSVDAELQSGEWQKKRSSYPRWTGTIVVNEAPGVKFGKTVEAQGVVFEVPKEYQGIKDAALVLDNSTIKIEEKDDKILLTAKVSKSQPYATKDGWYVPDADTGIPTNTGISSSDPNARYLWRTSKARIGPVARFSVDYVYLRRYVLVLVRLAYGLGVESEGQAQAGQEQAAKIVPAELIAEIRSNIAKLEQTSRPELVEATKKLLRILE